MLHTELRKDITVFTSAIYQTNCTVIRAPRSVFIIDPCWLSNEVQAIRRHVDEIKGRRKLYLIFTHSDYDHIIGYGAFPEAKVIASVAFARKADKVSDVAAAVKWDHEHYISRPYDHEFPKVSTSIETDGKAMHYSGTVMTFYLAPGHTADGLFIVWEPAGILIAGDYLSDVEFPFVEDNLLSYRRTMNKVDRIMRSHQINWMVPGHGTLADSRKDIFRRRDESLEYLDDLEKYSPETFPTAKYESRYEFWDSLSHIHATQINRIS